jgi:peroxiredoxin Q/BCP
VVAEGESAPDFTLPNQAGEEADEDHSVADLYGVWVEKSMYGKTYWGNERTTFVIDPEGKVARVLRKVKPGEHDELALSALAA